MWSRISSLTCCVIALCLILQLTACTRIPHDAPRDFGWEKIDYRTAKYSHHILPNGQVHVEITHLPLEGITPEMLL